LEPRLFSSRPPGRWRNRYNLQPHDFQSSRFMRRRSHVRDRNLPVSASPTESGKNSADRSGWRSSRSPGHTLFVLIIHFEAPPPLLVAHLAVEDIDHSRTKTKSPQTNGICERFHKTVLNEFYCVAFRKKVYRSTVELQADLDAGIKEYNEARPHQRRWCFGKTPMQTFLDAMPMTKEKMIAT